MDTLEAGVKPEWLEAMSVVSLKPGDVILLRSKTALPYSAVARLKACLEGVFPGHAVLVLEDGMEFGVAHPAEPAA